MRTVGFIRELRELLASDDEDLTVLNIEFPHAPWPPEAIEEFTAWLVSKSQLVILALDGVYSSFPDWVVPFLEAVLPHHPHLRDLFLYNFQNITAVHVPGIARVINNTPNVTSFHANIGNVGAQALAQGLLGNQSLEKLSLRFTGNRAEGLAAIADAALEMSGLKSLNLYGNPIEPDRPILSLHFVDSLANNHRLEDLDLGGVFEEVPNALSYFIRTVLQASHPSLRIVGLSRNNVTTEHLLLIMSAIQSNRFLAELDLGCNAIGNVGAPILAERIRGNQTLQKLGLHNNDIDAERLATIVMALQTTGVKSLNLNCNRLSVGNANNLLFLDTLAGNYQLEELEVECVFIEDPSALSYFVARVLPSLPSLRVLNLSGNNATGAHVANIATFIRGNKTLLRLEFCRHVIGDDDFEEIASALGQNTSLVYLSLFYNESITRRGEAALKECFRTSNFTLEELYIFSDEGPINGMETVLKDIIKQNGLLRDAFARLQNSGVPIPPRVWPRVMALANAKPELLYLILRSDANLIKREREHFELHTPDPIDYFG